MDDEIISKARASEWGFIDLQEGRFLFMRLDSERVVLVEPFGGYYFPFNERIHRVPMPDAKVLASALSGIPFEQLDDIREFVREPRTMLEIDTQFPGVQAWHLRKLGLLADVGRRQRRIISQWAGYDLQRLVAYVFELAHQGRRRSYDLAQPPGKPTV